MESWSYVSGEKGCVSESNSLPYCFGNNMIISGQQFPENHAFGEFSYGELIEKQPTTDSIGSTINPIMSTMNCFSDASTSKVSSSVVDSRDSRDSSLIDLKLGRFGDDQNHNFSKGGAILSSSESSTPPKRVRSTGLNSQTAYCQVYGCNKDLSSSKDYHKRHKVCEVHAKTAKVIVNGIEQRFCQQCSRFHLLAEFDDGKRSCRKRLAGHNERRRKPQIGFHSGRNGKLLHSYNDFTSNRYPGSMLSTTSYDWYKHIKAEEGTEFGFLPAIPIPNGHFPSVSRFPSSDFDRLFPPFHDNIGLASNGSILTDNSARYWSGSLPPFEHTSLGNEGCSVYDTASTIEEIPLSGIALSLLSSQSQNNNSSSSFTTSQVSEKLPSQASTSAVSKNFSSGMNSAPFHSLLISDHSETTSFDVANRIYHSEYQNTKDRVLSEEAPTIDLLQLSSQLQRVEHQRQSVKHSDDIFFGL